MAKTVTLEVNLHSGGAQVPYELSNVLDMLRYSGVLEVANVTSTPRESVRIYYPVNPLRAESIIARWKSFGYTANLVTQ